MSRARLVPPSPATLAEAAGLLAQGEVVGMPTETVYGLAGDATNPGALARIFAVKERPTFDPLIVHVLDAAAATEAGVMALEILAPAGRARFEELAQAFWPGPLTLVLPRGPRIPLLATSGLDTVAVRAPSHPVARALLEAAGRPLAAPSANRFGRISPTSAADVDAELGDRIELILDGGVSQVGVESTVVSVAGDGSLTLLRPGAVSAADLSAQTGAPVREPSRSGDHLLASPGLLANHYAPRKPLHLLAEALGDGVAWRSATWPAERALPARVGLLARGGSRKDVEQRAQQAFGREVEVQILSEGGDASEAARHLFAQLRALDASAAEVLFTEPWPSREGLGHAIVDRLGRAAVKG